MGNICYDRLFNVSKRPKRYASKGNILLKKSNAMKERITRSLQQNYHISWDDRYQMATLIEVGLFDADEDPAISYLALRERLDRGFFAAYPHMQPKQIKYDPTMLLESPYGIDIKEEKLEEEIGLIPQIRKCTSLSVLETFRLLIKNNSEAQAAYDEMYIKLTQK